MEWRGSCCPWCGRFECGVFEWRSVRRSPLIYQATQIDDYIYQLSYLPTMPNIKTNLIRMSFEQKFCEYQVNVDSLKVIEQTHQQQIELYFSERLPNTLYNHPFLFSPAPLPSNVYSIVFTSGVAVKINLTPVAPSSNLAAIGNLLGQKMMLLTNFLYSKELQACFNPFLEEEKQNSSTMPGWQVTCEAASSSLFLCINAIELQLHSHTLLGQDFDTLLDHDNGKFFLKENIVKVNKQLQQVIFRSGESCRRQALNPLTIHFLNGYPLAKGIESFLARIKEEGQYLIKSWNIQIDSRFLETQGSFPAAGNLSFRDKRQISVSPLITPMSSSNFTYNYVNLFSQIAFDEILKANLFIFSEEQNQQPPRVFRQLLEALGKKMELAISCKSIPYKDWQNLCELVANVNYQQGQNMHQKIYIIIHPTPVKAEKQTFNQTIQGFINNCIPFYLIPEASLHNLDEEEWKQAALHHLSILYTKSRINPWLLQSLPFNSQPTMLVNLHIKQTKQKLSSVAVVATMNRFFTKFTASHNRCSNQNLSQVVSQAILDCVNVFQVNHNRIPQRVFVVHSDATSNLNMEATSQQLRVKGSSLTYVSLNNRHLIRSYVQHDNNYLSRQNVKKVQLTQHIVINQNIFLQLELEKPPYQVTIHPVEKNDPNFVQKVIELICKVTLGGAGHKFGSGLGVLDYASKLNNYCEFNLSKWQGNLKEGILMFL